MVCGAGAAIAASNRWVHSLERLCLVANMGAMLGFCLPLVVMFVALFVVGSTETVSCPSWDRSPNWSSRHGNRHLGDYVSYRQVFTAAGPNRSSRRTLHESGNPV